MAQVAAGTRQAAEMHCCASAGLFFAVLCALLLTGVNFGVQAGDESAVHALLEQLGKSRALCAQRAAMLGLPWVHAEEEGLA